MESLPKVKGLNSQQQARLDGELTARKLITFKAQRARPMELVAALQVAFEVDAQSVLAAYGDMESQALQIAIDKASIEKINTVEVIEDMPEHLVSDKRSTRRGLRAADKE